MYHSGTVYRLLWRIHQRHSDTAKLKCGLLWWRTSQNSLRTSFSPIFFWRDLFLPFFWPRPWPEARNLTPPQYPSKRVLGTTFECDFRRLTLQVALTSWLDKLSLVNWFEHRPEARVTSQLDKRNLSSWLVKFHLCSESNASVGPSVLVFYVHWWHCMYVSCIGLLSNKTSLTLINRTRGRLRNKSLFVCLFVWVSKTHPITGLSGWRTPD